MREATSRRWHVVLQGARPVSVIRMERYAQPRNFFHEAPGTHRYRLEMPTNVLGTELRTCCRDPVTGFYRDGYCRTGPEDVGLHTVCAEMTRDFLDYSVLMGNDLVTPHPEWGFAGLEPGDRWCICVSRWKQALERGLAPPVDLEATHSSALEFVSLE